jgi:hypothetical protein
MSDEDRIRSLLTLAADLPDDVQAPVGSLLERGQRRRRLRAAAAVIGAAVVVAGAVTIPVAIRSLGTGQTPVRNPARVFPGLPPVKPTGPTAVQLIHFRWSTLAPSPLGPRSGPLLTWTGRYLIELGGLKKGNATEDGAVYDSATRHWRHVAPLTANVGFSNAVQTWTGRQLFVTNDQVAPCPGGVPDTRCLPHAGLYDPATNRWTYTLLPKQLDGLELQAAAWTGRDVILAAVGNGRLSVGSFDPATGRWTMITPRLPASHPPVAAELVASPARVLLWSMWSKTIKQSKNSYTVRSGIDVLSLGRTGWSTVTGNWQQHQTVDNPSYAGGQIFLAPSQIWCGLCSHPFVNFQARLVDPATLAASKIPDGPLVTRHIFQPPIWVWTGRTAIAATTGPQSSSTQHITKMAAYDPQTNSWHYLPSPPRTATAPTPAWAGTQLFLLTSTGALLTLHR